MAKCLRCGAGNEWLQGDVKPEDQAELTRLREENARLKPYRALSIALQKKVADLERQLAEARAKGRNEVLELARLGACTYSGWVKNVVKIDWLECVAAEKDKG